MPVVSSIEKHLIAEIFSWHTWIRKYSKPKQQAERTGEHIYDENKRLKKELATVNQERDLLKMATAYFAKEIRKNTLG